MLRKKIEMDNMEIVINATKYCLDKIATAKYNLSDSISYLEKYTKDPSAKNVFSKLEQNWSSLHAITLIGSDIYTYNKEIVLVGYTIDCFKIIRVAAEICQSLDEKRNKDTDKVFGWFALRAIGFFPMCV
jgi:hypothetical protein